jgi:hypothetical protein
VIGIDELWHCRDAQVWNDALNRYWDFVMPKNQELERRLESLDIERIRNLDAAGWYNFLHDEYFRWKYTAANRYATTTAKLRRYQNENRLNELYEIREELLQSAQIDVQRALLAATQIHGLGTSGASGLLALLYPARFATVDQFVVKSLCDVRDLPEAAAIARMNPDNITPADGALLIRIMQQKAAENNECFATDLWTPRQIDKVLWTYGR